MTVQEVFEEWLDGDMFWEKTRKQHAKEAGCDLLDLQWAFIAGYYYGLGKGLEEGSK